MKNASSVYRLLETAFWERKDNMKIPALHSSKSVTLLAVLYPIVLEFALYYNVIWYVQLFNILLLSILYGLFLMIFRRLKPTLITITAIMAGLSIANEFSIKARSVAFQVSDFFCLIDALRLSGRYRFTVTAGMVWAVCSAGFLLTAALVFLRQYDDKEMKRSNLFRGATAFCVALPLSLFTGIENRSDGDMKFNINDFTQKNGVLYSLYAEAKKHDIAPPDGYSAQEVQEMEEDAGSSAIPEKCPNIIVIMNESLADYDLVGDLNTTRDVLPFIHSMDENCIKGSALVSVFGGYTCNSEWEFLTGNTMAFLPVTAVPYNQFRDRQTDSLASSLKQLGYNVTAVHPYNGIEWGRDENYPNMGFDNFITGTDFGEVTREDLENLPDDVEKSLYFGDLEYMRGFVSDRENYRKLIDLMETKEPGKPQFIFNVTIQNHGSYTYEGEDFTEEEILPGAGKEINQYLTVAAESDKAFEEFIDYFTDYPEDTIVLMFGDHQPALDIPYTSRYADPDDSVAVREGDYTVPYVMWANYDVDWEDEECISLNYLSAVLKQNAQLPLDNWDTFRLDLKKDFAAINSFGIVNASGEYIPLQEGIAASEDIQMYEKRQYYRLFDKYPEN